VARILFIAPTPYFSDRGCHVRIYEEVTSLNRLGHETVICTYHLGKETPGVRTVRTPVVPWYRKTSAGPSYHKLYIDAMLMFQIRKTILSFRPDLLHAHLHEGVILAGLFKKWFSLPLVADLQGSMTGEMVDHHFMKPGSISYRVFHRLERWSYQIPDEIFTSSGESRNYFIEDFGVPKEKIRVVPDAVESASYEREFDREAFRNRLGVPRNRLVVGFLGLLTEYQGVDLLLETIPEVRKGVPEVHFLLMGYPNEEKYRDRTVKMGISEAVTFTGRVDYFQIGDYLRACDVGVSPKISKTEANGKLFNYMAAGLPSVVFDTPINREILGDAGIYADYGNSRSLAVRLIEILRNPEERGMAGVRLREKAKAHCSWESSAKLIENCYVDLLRKK
jgi:glycosyltransferase involved in cell wall biosynthesis